MEMSGYLNFLATLAMGRNPVADLIGDRVCPIASLDDLEQRKIGHLLIIKFKISWGNAVF
jgi:hypothetical protein